MGVMSWRIARLTRLTRLTRVVEETHDDFTTQISTASCQEDPR